MKLCLLLLACLFVGCVSSKQAQNWPEKSSFEVTLKMEAVPTTADAQVPVVTGTALLPPDITLVVGTQVSVPKRESLMDMLKGSASVAAGPAARSGDASAVQVPSTDILAEEKDGPERAEEE